MTSTSSSGRGRGARPQPPGPSEDPAERAGSSLAHQANGAASAVALPGADGALSAVPAQGAAQGAGRGAPSAKPPFDEPERLSTGLVKAIVTLLIHATDSESSAERIRASLKMALLLVGAVVLMVVGAVAAVAVLVLGMPDPHITRTWYAVGIATGGGSSGIYGTLRLLRRVRARRGAAGGPQQGTTTEGGDGTDSGAAAPQPDRADADPQEGGGPDPNGGAPGNGQPG